MVTVENLRVRLDNREILHDINLKVLPGEAMVVLGPSGSGKTVFLKTLLGLIKPFSGRIILCGQDIGKLDHSGILALREKTGMVFQSAALFDSLSIWENVGFFLLEHTNKEETEIRERAAEALGAVGLEGILDSKPEQLSGGMRKRVGIARALISKPQVIFYDEPTAGLDVLTADSIVRLIKKIHSQYKTTDVIVIHDIALARRLADRIAVIDEGSIVITGTWDEVVQFQHPLIRRFLSIGGDYEETNIHS